MPKNVDKTTLITSKTTVDYTTGEVKEEQTITQIKKGVEPNYIKLYINTLLAFKDLPSTLNPLLIEFLKYMSYADVTEEDGGQVIYVNIDMKKRIATKLKITLESVNKGLQRLTNNGVFKRIGTGTYQVNPHMFGKGEWKDISAIRATFNFNTGEVIANITTEEDNVNHN